MKEIDYRQQIELLIEELNFIAKDPVTRASKNTWGEFKYEYKELDTDEGIKSLYFMFCYEDTKSKPFAVNTLRRNYKVPKDQWDKHISNMYLKGCYQMVLRWALFGKTVNKSEGNNIIRGYSLIDLLKGRYETE